MINGAFVGMCIVNIINEDFADLIGNALLFSIDEFDHDETKDLRQCLSTNNFLDTSLIGKRATNNNLNYFGAYFPYDILHICSHGGETDGYFVKQRFTDDDGQEHIIEYFEVVSFRPSPKGDQNIHVERKVIFTTFDGIPWLDRPLGRHPRHVGNAMMHAIRERDDKLKRKPVNVPIALSAHIKCHESFNQGAFDSLAAHTHPIVFNNSCSSSHELSELFLAAGARSYLSSLWNVGSTTAKEAALAFYDELFKTGKVLDGFSAMLRSIKNPQYRDIYIYWGLHFSSLQRPAAKDDGNIIAGLLSEFQTWMDRLAHTSDEHIKVSARAIVEFISSQVMRLVPPQRFEQILASIPPQPEIERCASQPQEFESGEVIITQQQPRAQADGE
jgi:hypothetical protein